MKVYSYKKGLDSVARLVKQGIGVWYDTSKPRRGRVVCSWGASDQPPWYDRVKWINDPAAIPLVADKLKWAEFCRGRDHVIQFTTNTAEARTWADGERQKVLCRTLTNASGGRGIVVARDAFPLIGTPSGQDPPAVVQSFHSNKQSRI